MPAEWEGGPMHAENRETGKLWTSQILARELQSVELSNKSVGSGIFMMLVCLPSKNEE